ncbi:hypothetical protein BDQ12DRAFT_633851 [Crucibulum laeve]|uniref:DUF7729 domain-containing protein n=1 Tax=Crucibulum laeve TaxID=68775 RepID=A0A5C3LUT6_9AGAR|nr:hypothetical protein BDQ12DRAFT_633851 [Crucibulum laeve]
MFKSLAIISLFTTVAFAQSSSQASSTTTANPLIPSGISSACSTFMTTMNNNKDLTACTSSLINATSAFGPGGSATSSPSKSTVTSTLTALCASNAMANCPEELIRTTLTNFYTACTKELTSNPNPDLIRAYDVLFAITPLRNSVCTQDDDGTWCAMKAKAPASAGLTRRADTSALVPNITSYHNTNLPFLFLSPSADASTLCQTCTVKVVAAYTDFESKVQYGPGLGNSKLLDTQSALTNGIKTTCGDNFLLGGGNAAAAGVGGISSGPLSSGALSNTDFQSIVALTMGVVSMVITALL